MMVNSHQTPAENKHSDPANRRKTQTISDEHSLTEFLPANRQLPGHDDDDATDYQQRSIQWIAQYFKTKTAGLIQNGSKNPQRLTAVNLTTFTMW